MRKLLALVMLALLGTTAAFAPAQTESTVPPDSSGTVTPPAPSAAASPGGTNGSAAAAAASTAGTPIYSRQTTFTIPFTAEAKDPAKSEVQLFVSTDRGVKWQWYTSRRPSDGHFPFRAARDGDYWFASRTVPVAERNQPVTQLRPGLYVRIDTVEPRMLLTAAPTSSGEVLIGWRIVDENLAPESLVIECQGGTAQAWQPVAVSRNPIDPTTLQGTASWKPNSGATMADVRAEVRDRAGNRSLATRRVYLPNQPAAGAAAAVGGAAASGIAANSPPPDPYRPGSTTPSARSGAAVPWPADNRFPPPKEASATGLAGTGIGATGDAGAQTPSASSAPGTAGTAGSTAVATSPAHQSPVSGQTNPYFAGSTNPRYVPAAGDVAPPVARQVSSADQESTPAPSSSTNEPTASGPPAGERPQMTNSRRFNLDYDVDTVGPSGLSEVELWATRDGGQTWAKWGSDADKQSPFQIEVDEEGTYGFRMVVVGGSGLASSQPQPGDAADVWVGVDTTAPTARITSAIYGSAQNAGKLDIRWEAADQRLSERPITLSYGEHPDGPWNTIGAGLPNTGQYFWTVDTNIPRQIYLRIEVRDEAGNTFSYQVPDPISIEALAPQGRIRTLKPVRESRRGATNRSSAR